MNNSPGTISTANSTGSTEWNFTRSDPLPSVDDIAEIYENELEEHAIFIAGTEVSCLDELSLDGDLPDNISVSE